MYPLYKELREKLGEPLWVDQNGVPRYCEFHPDIASEIYGDWVALMEVECQSCGKVFKCARGVCRVMEVIKSRGQVQLENTAAQMIPYLIGWGDAPWHDADGNEAGFDNQCAGTTMSTDILSFRVWYKDRDGKNNEFEGWAEVSDPEHWLECR